MVKMWTLTCSLITVETEKYQLDSIIVSLHTVRTAIFCKLKNCIGLVLKVMKIQNMYFQQYYSGGYGLLKFLQRNHQYGINTITNFTMNALLQLI